MGDLQYTTTTSDRTVIDTLVTSAKAIGVSNSYITQDDLRIFMEEKKPDVDPKTKSTLSVSGNIIKVTYYKDGFKQYSNTLIPNIIDVLVYNDKVVTVKFADNTEEKAVLNPEDNFSIEQGISVCIAKKLVGDSSVYNKLIDYALKVKKNNEVEKAKKLAEEAEKKEKNRLANQKRAEKNRKKREAEETKLAKTFMTAMAGLIKGLKENDEH